MMVATRRTARVGSPQKADQENSAAQATPSSRSRMEAEPPGSSQRRRTRVEAEPPSSSQRRRTKTDAEPPGSSQRRRTRADAEPPGSSPRRRTRVEAEPPSSSQRRRTRASRLHSPQQPSTPAGSVHEADVSDLESCCSVTSEPPRTRITRLRTGRQEDEEAESASNSRSSRRSTRCVQNQSRAVKLDSRPVDGPPVVSRRVTRSHRTQTDSEVSEAESSSSAQRSRLQLRPVLQQLDQLSESSLSPIRTSRRRRTSTLQSHGFESDHSRSSRAQNQSESEGVETTSSSGSRRTRSSRRSTRSRGYGGRAAPSAGNEEDHGLESNVIQEDKDALQQEEVEKEQEEEVGERKEKEQEQEEEVGEREEKEQEEEVGEREEKEQQQEEKVGEKEEQEQQEEVEEEEQEEEEEEEENIREEHLKEPTDALPQVESSGAAQPAVITAGRKEEPVSLIDGEASEVEATEEPMQTEEPAEVAEESVEVTEVRASDEDEQKVERTANQGTSVDSEAPKHKGGAVKEALSLLVSSEEEEEEEEEGGASDKEERLGSLRAARKTPAATSVQGLFVIDKRPGDDLQYYREERAEPQGEPQEEEEEGGASDKEERLGSLRAARKTPAATSVQGLFVIDKRPGDDLQYYREERAEPQGEPQEEEEEEFIDEEDEDEDGDEDEDAKVLFTSRSSETEALSSRIDAGLRPKQLGGLYISLEGGSGPASGVPQKEPQKKHQDEVMRRSVIGADFMKKEAVPPYSESKHALKLKRRAERDQSTGDSWFNMKAPEVTAELKGDLQLLKMRGSLDPKRFYKKNDRDGLPKYFQVGTVVDDPADFYHSRVPKKQRKRTMVEELLADAHFRQKNKQRFNQIMAEKAAQAAGKKNRKRNKFHRK